MGDLVRGSGFNADFGMDDQPKIMPGTWWRSKVAHSGGYSVSDIPAGTILLCVAVEFAHGSPHAATLNVPPSAVDEDFLKRGYGYNSLSSYRMKVDELEENYEFVPASVAHAEREKEVQAIMAQISADQEGLSELQSEMSRISVSAINPIGLLNGGDGASQLPPEQRMQIALSIQDDVTKRASSLSEISQKIEVRAAMMQNKSRRIAVYHQERAAEAMASITPIQQVAARIMEQVDTIGLYAGTSVRVDLLKDGNSAPAFEKLHIFQAKLYMDEELLINLLDGGADCTNYKDFVMALQSDETLVERIFGAKRSVVLMQPRRNMKERHVSFGDMGVAEALSAIQEIITKQEIDREAFLLIRDGDRIWEVTLPYFLNNVDRLFPTPSDLSAPYTDHRWYIKERAQRIDETSINYAKSVEAFRQMSLVYERLLLVLWGLHDRMNIFGPIMDGLNTSFADPDFQRERLNLVMDDQNVIGYGNRPSYNVFMAAENKKLKPGSRIIANFKNLFTHRTNPKYVDYDRKSFQPIFKVNFCPAVGIATTRRDGSDIVTDAHISWRDRWVDGDFDRRVFKAKAYLNHSLNNTSYDQLSYFVLDEVHHEDLDYYLNSRYERRNYIKYVAILIEAKRVLKLEAEQDQPVTDWLYKQIDSARLDRSTAELKLAVMKTIRSWRATNKGNPPPHPGTVEFEKIKSALMDGLWKFLGTTYDAGVEDRIETAVQEIGGDILQITSNTSAGIKVYFQDGDDTILPHEVGFAKSILGEWPYIKRADVKLSSSGDVTLNHVKYIRSNDLKPGELVTREFKDIPNLKAAHSADILLDMISGFKALIESSTSKTNTILNPNRPTDAMANELLNAAIKAAVSRKGYKSRALLLAPVGIGQVFDDGEFKLSGMFVGIDAFFYLSRWDGIRGLVKNAITKMYQPGRAFEDIENYSTRFDFTLFSKPLTKKLVSGCQIEGELNGFILDASASGNFPIPLQRVVDGKKHFPVLLSSQPDPVEANERSRMRPDIKVSWTDERVQKLILETMPES